MVTGYFAVKNLNYRRGWPIVRGQSVAGSSDRRAEAVAVIGGRCDCALLGKHFLPIVAAI